MKELRKFIKGLNEREFQAVSLEEVFGHTDAKLIELDNLLSSIKEIGVQEVVDVYHESFEFIAGDGRYCAVHAFY